MEALLLHVIFIISVCFNLVVIRVFHYHSVYFGCLWGEKCISVFKNTLKHIERVFRKVRSGHLLTARLPSSSRWMHYQQEEETPIISRFFTLEYLSESNFKLSPRSTPLNAFSVFVDWNRPSVHVNYERQEIVTIKFPFFQTFSDSWVMNGLILIWINLLRPHEKLANFPHLLLVLFFRKLNSIHTQRVLMFGPTLGQEKKERNFLLTDMQSGQLD